MANRRGFSAAIRAHTFAAFFKLEVQNLHIDKFVRTVLNLFKLQNRIWCIVTHNFPSFDISLI
ncbi:hypothetical protein HMP0721_0830 [Pseudoramibacter alactolyticus ATCC 23263]|uniref:Uncharacterized protein n=1 Tax=Pseudoramibacter alactolyticus ATCC 23263 TaxID=887929 RepID=E6MFR9_9FIRM|nr:hypothetical protein HMP0721_0830 [Pseudoramibacter alactolyticus ATCC 23263]